MVTIPRVIMDSIRFYGYVNEEGKANWEIYQSEMDSVDESSSSPLPKIVFAASAYYEWALCL